MLGGGANFFCVLWPLCINLDPRHEQFSLHMDPLANGRGLASELRPPPWVFRLASTEFFFEKLTFSETLPLAPGMGLGDHLVTICVL